MKKVVFSLIFASFLFGCNKEDDSPSNPELIGKWTLVVSHIKEFSNNELIWEGSDSSDVRTEYYIFNKDNTFEYFSMYIGEGEGDSEDIMGEYIVDGNQIKMSVGDLKATFDFKIEDDKELTIFHAYTIEGYDYEMTSIYRK